MKQLKVVIMPAFRLTSNAREHQTQEELIRQFCEEQGHDLRYIYSDDGVTGTIELDKDHRAIVA
jgi:hypothetical protein